MLHSYCIKWDLIAGIISFVHKLPYQLPDDLRVKKLGHKEILGESQNCLGTQPSRQSLGLICFGNSNQKLHKNTKFSAVIQFCLFFYFCTDIFVKIGALFSKIFPKF